jgi:hypothetical protein
MSNRVIASGTLMVTGTGEVVIDESIPKSRAMLVQPDLYVTVQFDPSEPPPPPCAGGLPDEVDWELFFKHIHDTHLTKEKAEQLKLKIEWRVSAARTVVWQVLDPIA